MQYCARAWQLHLDHFGLEAFFCKLQDASLLPANSFAEMRIATATWNANEQLQKATRARGLDFSTWFEPRKSEVDSFSQRGAPEIYAIAFQSACSVLPEL